MPSTSKDVNFLYDLVLSKLRPKYIEECNIDYIKDLAKAIYRKLFIHITPSTSHEIFAVKILAVKNAFSYLCDWSTGEKAKRSILINFPRIEDKKQYNLFIDKIDKKYLNEITDVIAQWHRDVLSPKKPKKKVSKTRKRKRSGSGLRKKSSSQRKRVKKASSKRKSTLKQRTVKRKSRRYSSRTLRII